MRPVSRLFALFSACLVLFAGLAPGLERCSMHGNPMGDDVMPGMTASHPATPIHAGHFGAPGWTASGPSATSGSTTCSLMATCSSPCYVAGSPVVAGSALGRLAAAIRSTPALLSLLTAPESPPPKV